MTASETEAQLHSVCEGIVRIELPPVVEVPPEMGGPVNVYLIEGESPALINAGHPAHTDELVRALRNCEITPADIERIVATSWRIDVLGGATRFPRADLFVSSPDMKTPRDLESHVDELRNRWLERGEQLADALDEFALESVERAVDHFYPRTTSDLRFAPLRSGHFVRAGSLRLEVMGTAGPGPGHMALFEPDEKLLFCGDFAMSGLPDRLEETQGYIVSLERLAELSSERVFPNRGRTYEQGRWTVSRAVNFLNNFLSNAPAALVREPTVLEFLERDRGRALDEPVEVVVAYEQYRTLLDELVRTRTVAADGEGLDRRYGVDVDDPRDKVRNYSPPESDDPSPDSTP